MFLRFPLGRQCIPQCLSRGSIWERTPSARFSQSASQFRDESSANPINAGTTLSSTKPTEQETEVRDKRNDDHREQNAKRTGATLPAFVLFAAAVPLGWYLNNRNQGAANRTSNPTEFVKYTLIGKDNVSSTCAIFRLRPSQNVAIDLDDPASERAITSVEFKQPQLQIARSYTCLPQDDAQPVDELRFLIRREQKGEVSNFLHRLSPGAEIEARGLHAEYTLPQDVESVVFLVGGTGIAPAAQVADMLDGQASVHILWASRRREDCIGGHNDTPSSARRWAWWTRPTTAVTKTDSSTSGAEKGAIVLLLERMKQRNGASEGATSRLAIDYFVDEEGSAIKTEDVKNTLGSVSNADGTNGKGKKILFVSGPEGFINHWAGSKQWSNGKEVQGPLKGILSTMDLKEWEVVKL